MNYKVIPIPSEIAQSVRENLVSPQYNHPAFVEVSTGYGPCRQCLKKLFVGKDERILFTYNAFENLSSLPLPSPVFIHKNVCEPYKQDGFPAELVDLPLLFESFGKNSELIKQEPIMRERLDDQITESFENLNVNYINIRNAEAGCFVARIESVSTL